MFDRQAFPVALARSVFCQVLLALRYCHHVYDGQWTLIHRDLKPENGESHGCKAAEMLFAPRFVALARSSKSKTELANPVGKLVVPFSDQSCSVLAGVSRWPTLA